MTFLDHIRVCNAHEPADFQPFWVEGQALGWIRPAFARHLAGFPEIFTVDTDHVTLSAALKTPDSRTQALRQVTASLHRSGLLPPAKGEDYAIVEQWGRPVRFLLDRAHVSAFGLKAFGVHMNGFVRRPDGLKLWIGRRAPDKSVAPNKLDNMVAGGQPAGLTLGQNLLKEAAEEADIPAALASQATPVGALSYCMTGELGLKPDTMFLFDLELPADFIPRNTDGEISDFTLMDVRDVAERVRTSHDFKFNVNLVIIDFLIRHGLITGDDEPDYAELVSGLRKVLP